ncbi:hypothetical protein AGLY_008641 [Aphis glycines]|uniref:Uncharacterized protein n=1 Tax=Aphis glycines TaxID=307491 RepID=A0A6G0TKS2_APHGL|nr:hypothetical protein AGLY_008641 [Aphis glycines]
MRFNQTGRRQPTVNKFIMFYRHNRIESLNIHHPVGKHFDGKLSTKRIYIGYFFNSSIRRSQLNLGHTLSEAPNGTKPDKLQCRIPHFSLAQFSSRLTTLMIDIGTPVTDRCLMNDKVSSSVLNYQAMLSFLQVVHAKNSITLKWIKTIKQFKNKHVPKKTRHHVWTVDKRLHSKLHQLRYVYYLISKGTQNMNPSLLTLNH